MKVVVKPGLYVLAVSGGIDSMVLLDLLHDVPGVRLIVAHFDHGIRSDSEQDRRLVQQAADHYGLPFVYEAAQLGPDCSEAQARAMRYAFLDAVCERKGADALITAHHQDDVIETILLALMRGTGRKGLTSLRSTPTRLRPLLAYTKNELKRYATIHGLTWHEDSTNNDPKYRRNYVRKTFMPRMNAHQRQQFIAIYTAMMQTNDAIDEAIDALLDALRTDDGFVRQMFIMLPHAVASEVMAAILRRHNVRNLSRQLVGRLVVAVKVAAPHTMHDVDAAFTLRVDKKTWRICPRISRKSD